MKEQRLLTEAKKSRQTASPNASKSIEELEKKLYFVKSKRREERLLIEAEKSRQTASKNSKFWVLLLLSRFERFEGTLSAEK